ncbi:MAG: ABC transporter substrate-binding protein, partial [Clostridiales bacterium]|nr:ABC transporter substrate-binding protein [Clostridiales bacterium]
VTLIGPKEWHNNKLLSLQSGLKGIKIAVASDFNGETAETENYKEFTEAYQKKYGNKNQDQGTVMAYDAYMLAIEAIEKAGSTDGAKVRDALAKTRDYSGASGVITFNKLGVPSKPVNIDVIKDGAFKTVYVYKVK